MRNRHRERNKNGCNQLDRHRAVRRSTLAAVERLPMKIPGEADQRY